jgi:leucyl-tRNA synthetase
MFHSPETRSSAGATTASSAPPHRYSARLANEIELRWQDHWEREGTFLSPNPEGDLAKGFEAFVGKPKLYVLDMFPYPSGVGLHVGHPLGYIATDIYARFARMAGHNVLHAMGFDAFGLPAEQYAVQTGTHPRVTTEKNIATMRAQLRRLGLGHDPRRSVATTDVPFYRWTQWIFLQLFNAWYDEERDAARPISELEEEFESGKRNPQRGGEQLDWSSADARTRRGIVNGYRLAYVAEAPVNWCPALGTVLSNEEVTADGRSERGNHPVYKRPLKQWMMRITKYAERLLDDLAIVDWPEPVKLMQRNWIGRSTGATVRFECAPESGVTTPISVYTTRPDTLFGATYMVLAPEHPLVGPLTANEWPNNTPTMWRGGGQKGVDAPKGGFDSPAHAVESYRRHAEAKSDVDRQAEAKTKTGVFTGSYAINPVSGKRIPIFIADYVLMGYGEGAIMAVPAHDDRDFEFATQFGLDIPPVYRNPDGATPELPFAGEGVCCNSRNETVSLDGLGVQDAKERIVRWLEEQEHGKSAVNYKLRDWLFSRQRYWGEPFPIVFDEDGLPRALPESMLPVTLPDLENFRPEASDDPDAPPRPPLGRATEWTTVDLDLGDGKKTYTRELNTMPQWAGSCWYYLRYLDPTNDNALCDPVVERYWMKGPVDAKGESLAEGAGGVDLYVGGVEHAVLHLLYARFWHKALFDLGHVSTPEPFARLVNQGYIQAFAYTDARGVHVEAEEVEERDGAWFHDGKPVSREYGKMGKSLKNATTPDDICEGYGADTLRLYEMYMGPLEQSKPWNTRDIIGVHRFLQRVWRNVIDEETGAVIVTDQPLDAESQRILHKTIAGAREDMARLSFNTAIAKLIECNNHFTQVAASAGGMPRAAAEPMALMLAPLVPHFAEELWLRLGHDRSLAYEPFPEHDPALVMEDTVEIPVQILGKVRAKVMAPAGADAKALEDLAMADEKVKGLLEGKTVRKVIVVPGRLVNIVAN